MIDLKKLKYKEDIELLIKEGIDLPEDLYVPGTLQTFRWVFDFDSPKNHIPVYKQNPQRIIKDTEKNNLSSSGYALSCYDAEENAESNFLKYSNSHPNFWKLVGNSICSGFLNEPDGVITEKNEIGHFDLYEYIQCNLSINFRITKKLI